MAPAVYLGKRPSTIPDAGALFCPLSLDGRGWADEVGPGEGEVQSPGFAFSYAVASQGAGDRTCYTLDAIRCHPTLAPTFRLEGKEQETTRPT